MLPFGCSRWEQAATRGATSDNLILVLFRQSVPNASLDCVVGIDGDAGDADAIVVAMIAAEPSIPSAS